MPVVVALLLTALLALGTGNALAATPTAVVALGDSEISGEGAGSYESGTNGPANYCHRSLKAWIKVLAVPADAKVNLACSGANSANLTSGSAGQYGEASQADRLAALLAQYRVTHVLVTVGANDDPQFGPTATRCVTAYVLLTGNGCARTDGPTWASRVAAMQPKVQAALASINAVMSGAPYPYEVILVSYASPAPASTRYYDWQYWSKVYNGCPLYNADARWGHDVATPTLDAGVRTVAAGANVRFLDLVTAFEGHELCARGIGPSQEWVRGVTYAPNLTDWYTSHAVQQSLHPNALGHAKIAGCVAEFVGRSYREGACQIGDDGNLHARLHP